jgi:alcohol dehydrogenase class IV
MMRPMKLAGRELLFGRGCLEHLKTLRGGRALIVTGGSSMRKSGILDRAIGFLAEAGLESLVFGGVEPDPSFSTVLRGARAMRDFGPDWIIALGGGSAMDAAKAMWVYYEHPELSRLADILPPAAFPILRGRARLVCIPSTSGTASEVSRSIVITDDASGLKHGIGNMEMMPDIAICDPEVTLTMPPSVTAETGMDALTHAMEAFVSNRANYLSDVLAIAAIKDIARALPVAFRDGSDLAARETMLNASMTAGLAFTNVSLGIVHSMAHTLGGFFGLAHGLADAVILPYAIRLNSTSPVARERYALAARGMGAPDCAAAVEKLNRELGIPPCIGDLVPDRAAYLARLDAMADLALADGCTKTNPVIPDRDGMKELFVEVYGRGAAT